MELCGGDNAAAERREFNTLELRGVVDDDMMRLLEVASQRT
jgi:hypothetical protein